MEWHVALAIVMVREGTERGVGFGSMSREAGRSGLAGGWAPSDWLNTTDWLNMSEFKGCCDLIILISVQSVFNVVGTRGVAECRQADEMYLHT